MFFAFFLLVFWVRVWRPGAREQGPQSPWKGRSRPGRQARPYPFIQLGTTESDMFGFRGYFAFWSDTAVDFHPQPMRPVAAGDRVGVSMTRRGGVWHLVVDALSSGHISTTNVTYGGNAPFTQTEWFQEDPTPSNITGADLSYPKMTDVRFTKVLLNGGLPHLVLGNGQTLMATGGVFRVPTPFVGDSFDLVPPTGYGRQYLADVYRLDMAIDAYNVQLFEWDGLGPGEREISTRILIAAYQVFDRALARQHWPPAAGPALAELASENNTIIANLTAWVTSPRMDMSSPYVAAFRHAQRGLAATRVRAVLGLAPV